MRIIDIVNGPWAIKPDMLQEIQRIYAAHLHRGQKLDPADVVAAVEAATGRSVRESQAGMYQAGDVAVIPVHGVIGKRMNLFTRICGGASTEAIAADFQAAMDDPAVRAIVLHMDSPGGTVDGTQALADRIAASRGRKPVVACADGMMCSAAYWLGAQADHITMADLTTDVGSIGVVASHMDISGWEEKQGIKTTEITAGKYKRAISQYAPLSDEGRALIQSDLDQIYSLFVDAVAAGRDTSAEQVLADMAEGRVFLGQKAIDAGLVDSVATLAETIAMASAMARNPVAHTRIAASAAANHDKEVSIMTLDQLKADHPELVEAIAAEAIAGQADALAAARAEGAAAERERINAVRAQAIPGHEALIEQLAFDGTSTAADAALAIVAAEKKQQAAAAADLDKDANDPVPPAGADDGATRTIKRKEFDALDQQARRAFFAEGGKIVD